MKRLLLVEDDKVYASLVQRRIGKVFDIDEVSTLGEALEQMLCRSYDAVLLDVGLPDVTRDEAVKKLKQSQPAAFVLVLSGYADPNFIRSAIMDNASGYYVKSRDDENPELLASSIRLAINSNEACRKLDVANHQTKEL